MTTPEIDQPAWRGAGNDCAFFEERCWDLLLRRRDKEKVPGELGSFYYGVRSTGIYCRPSCPSRLPRRENARFFERAEDAERAGFRACFRCLPKEESLAEKQLALVEAACRSLKENRVSLDELAGAAGMSRFHFHRIFRKVTGMTPKAYEKKCRSVRIRAALSQSRTVTEAIYAAGFQSSSRFYAEATGALGMKARSYLKLATMTIKYIIKPCSLGYVLLGATEGGVCALILSSKKGEVLEGLREYFPKAELVEAGDELSDWGERALKAVEEPREGWTLDAVPLDLQGTPFQQKVWQMLREIPCGSTASYGELAGKLGMPTGARAVASACAANRVAIAVPCHRVVHGNGTISGYRWGVERKRALLKREGAEAGGCDNLR